MKNTLLLEKPVIFFVLATPTAVASDKNSTLGILRKLLHAKRGPGAVIERIEMNIVKTQDMEKEQDI